MITVTANLQNIIGPAAELGSVLVQLCGYGQIFPVVPGTKVLARVTEPLTPDANGAVSFEVVANDSITPAGTYYTVTVRDSNGDVVQCNAYHLLGDGTTQDLSTLTPFDPSYIPPPVIPTPPTGTLLVVPYSPNLVFDGSLASIFQTTLLGAVNSVSFINGQPGAMYGFIILMDAAGNHLWPVPWSGNVRGGSPIAGTPYDQTVQGFFCRSDGSLDQIGPAVYTP